MPQSTSCNRFQSLLNFCLFVMLCLTSPLAKAQELRNSDYRYFGFEANFGVKSTKISSDIAAINNMGVMKEGGSLGLVIGNQIVKARLQVAGFYYSNCNVKHAVNLVESALLLNLYPLKFINKSRQALNPYVSSGIDFNSRKFFGHYTTSDSKVNYSGSAAPYIGKINSTRGIVGGGIEWRLPQMRDFVHLFAEARYSWTMNQDADELLKNTKATDATSITIGVSFGFLR